MRLAQYLLWLCLLIQGANALAGPELDSARRATVYAQQLVDSGETTQAVQFLEQALAKFPGDDNLHTLYGEALWDAKEPERAEAAFRQALTINPQNTVAKNFVEVIRAIRNASVSEDVQLFESVVWDKVGDIAVLAIGFFLGSVLSGIFRKFTERRYAAHAKRLFKIGQYDEFADVLEIQLAENNLRPLRRSLAFMLENKSLDECIEIFSQYVNTEENLNTLTRMIRLSQNSN